MSKILDEEVKPPPIRGQLVPDVYKAMQSLCRYEVPSEAQAPFWLAPHEWEPDDLLVFRNGILNVRQYLEGQSDFFIPLTPQLFFIHAAAFDFDPQARLPERWFAFLDSLGQDETWKTCLQQIMGYLIWCGYDLQKFFQFVGPPRAGKGIIAGVLKGLLGGEHSTGSLRLRDFATEFGLEDALDKRLVIVPEVTLPSEDVTNIIARIKAITGGDSVSVNRKNKKQITVRLPVKMLMLTNEFLILPDNSGAVHGRTIPLKFTKSFLGKEDTTLENALKEEYAAILNWALEGVRSLLANDGRFTLPESSQNELDQLKMESAPLHDFVDECCDLDSRLGCHCQSLYRIYVDWHQHAHPEETPLSEAAFPGELKKTVTSISKARLGAPGERQYRGTYTIVETIHDMMTRAPIWLGIAPKPELRLTATAAIPVLSIGNCAPVPPSPVPQ